MLIKRLLNCFTPINYPILWKSVMWDFPPSFIVFLCNEDGLNLPQFRFC